MTVTIDDPLLGKTELVNSAFHYANADSGVTGPAPLLGEHNQEILREDLDYDAAQIHELEEMGVLQATQI